MDEGKRGRNKVKERWNSKIREGETKQYKRECDGIKLFKDKIKLIKEIKITSCFIPYVPCCSDGQRE